MIIALIGIITLVLLIWTITFTMATESRAEQRRIEGLESGLYSKSSHYAA